MTGHDGDPGVSRRRPPSLLMVATVSATIRGFLLPYATHFRGLGWRVEAAANGVTSDPGLEGVFDELHELPLSRSIIDAGGIVRTLVELSRILKGGFDIVHVHTPIAAFVTRAAIRRLPAGSRPAVVYTAHGLPFDARGGRARNAVFVTAEQIAGRWTDRLVVINEQDHAAALRHRIVPRRHLVLMPGIGVDTAWYSRSSVPADEIEAARAHLGIEPGTAMFVVVGELTIRKRPFDVVAALGRMTHRDCHLVLRRRWPAASARRGGDPGCGRRRPGPPARRPRGRAAGRCRVDRPRSREQDRRPAKMRDGGPVPRGPGRGHGREGKSGPRRTRRWDRRPRRRRLGARPGDGPHPRQARRRLGRWPRVGGDGWSSATTFRSSLPGTRNSTVTSSPSDLDDRGGRTAGRAAVMPVKGHRVERTFARHAPQQPGGSAGLSAMSEPWLPAGRTAAVTFSIDDVHPGRSTDAYEAGGDLGAGPWDTLPGCSSATLDFGSRSSRRRTGGSSRRSRLAGCWPASRVCAIGSCSHPRSPPGTMRLDRHPDFVDYLRDLPRTEIGLHGLHHINRGARIPVEFLGRSQAECTAMLGRGLEIFEAAGLPRPRGMSPPGWAIDEDLAAAMIALGLEYVASARDLITPVSGDATTAMSGLHGVSLAASRSGVQRSPCSRSVQLLGDQLA